MPLIKETNYNLLTKQLQSLIEDEQNLIAILSNTSAILNDNLIKLIGLVLSSENEELILGPFQGHPACVHIAIGKVSVVLQLQKIKLS